MKIIFAFFKKIYGVWFPLLDIAVLAFIYLFLWGEHINPYRHYQLIKYGEVAIGKVSGEDGLYKNSDSPRMRYFDYTFALPNGRIIKSSAHTFIVDEAKGKQHKYPVNATISYLPNQPEINWIKSDLSDTLGDFFYRHFVFGTLFISMAYLISMIVIRVSLLEYREEKQAKLFVKQARLMIQLSKEQLN